MAVEREEEFQCVLEKDLDCQIEESNSEESPIRAVLDGEDIIRHLECPDVNERELLRLDLTD